MSRIFPQQNMPLYEEYYLNKATERFVRKIWVINNSSNSTPSFCRELVPNGCFNVAIISGSGIDVRIADKLFHLEENVFVHSQVLGNAIITFKENTKVIFIQFEPWITSYLNKYDFSNFRNTIIQIDVNSLLFGITTKTLLTKTIEELIVDIETYFRKNIKQFSPKTEIEIVCRYILDSKGKVQIQDIYKKIRTSQRTFQNHFKKAMGIPLSSFINIIKIRSSIDELCQKNKTITTVALDNNFYDQAHYIRNFKQITKVTPKKFVPSRYLLSKID